MFVDETNAIPLEVTPEEQEARKAAMLKDIEAMKDPAQEEYDRLERREQVLLQREISARQAALARARTRRMATPPPPMRRAPARRSR